MPIGRARMALVAALLSLGAPAAAQPLDAPLLEQQAVEHVEAGRYREALSLYERLLAERESNLPRIHPAIVAAIDRVADMHSALGDFARALSLYQRAHGLRVEALGSEHPIVVDSLEAIARVELRGGDYQAARRRFEQVLTLRDKAGDELAIAITSNNLAETCLHLGDFLRAEPLYERALAIFERASGPDHPDVATLLSNLASVYIERGEAARALAPLERALAIRERAHGHDHPEVAVVLNNLGEARLRLDDLAGARPLFERALAIREKAFGPNDARIVVSVHNLAALHDEAGDGARAEPLYLRALEIYAASRAPDDPDASRAKSNLASLYEQRGELVRAEVLYEQAIASQERTLGSSHPLVSITRHNLAVLHLLAGDLTRALEEYRRADDAAERHLALMMSAGSEDERSSYAETLRFLTYGTIAFQQQRAAGDRDAAQLALATVLRRKGRVLDAVTGSLAALRGRLEQASAAQLDELAVTRAALAAASLGGRSAELPVLEQRAHALEVALGRASAEFAAVDRPASVAAVQQRIAPAAALVEIARYQPFDPARPRLERWGAPRYAAYVLLASGDPASVDLGEAAPLDAAIDELRTALGHPRSANVVEAGRKLGEQVMGRIEPLLAGRRELFVSPDGALHLVPWGAFVDGDNRHLIERFTFTYLTSGRDLLRFGLGEPSRNPPTIVANPAFDTVPSGARAPAPSRGAAPRARFEPLPGTAAEAALLGELVEGARLVTAERATKAALRELRGPSILHIATHGFFLGAPSSGGASGSRGLELASGGTSAAAPSGGGAPLDRPLLRSGLALAGANTAGDAADGVLTALEASSLDLHGTELVVLSACETGVGDVRDSEGVYGLRRALVVAGAQTQVMSLWRVDDDATRALMTGYYQRLEQGAGRSAAMRSVQLALRADERTAHPFYWASFIVSGDPSKLRAVKQSPAPVAPGPRGCACGLAGGAPPRGLGLLGLIAALALNRGARFGYRLQASGFRLRDPALRVSTGRCRVFLKPVA